MRNRSVLLFVILSVMLGVMLSACHEEDFPYFHLITPEPGTVTVLPTVTPTPELPPLPTTEPNIHPEAVCSVKGNISRSGDKIYHIEGQANYNQVVIDPDHGERCFDTEEEAVQAGWRKSQR